MRSSPSRLLRLALRANGAFSLASAALLLARSGAVVAFLGILTPPEALTTGALLAFFGAVLLLLSTRALVPPRVVVAIIVMDVLWTPGTVWILWLPRLPLTNPGRIAIAGVAAVVLCFAYLQATGLRRTSRAQA